MIADFIRWICRVCGVAAAAVGGSVHAGVATDGTAGPRVHLSGDFEIGADLGRQAGRNLFHSFERFSLDAGERATFSGPDAIRNVISRVTGGAPSEIDGTLRSAIPGADFYFLNPAGVMFGPNASLDLQGSFHVSTADELRFADGAKFSATNPAASSFTVAAPEAFGFLGARPAPIMVESASLTVLEGQSLSLVGGELSIASPSAFADNLSAPGGRINLVSAASAGEVVLDSGADSASLTRFGLIRLSDSADLDTTGPGGGSVQIRGGELVVINNSTVFADNTGPSDATGGIALDAETVTIGSGSRVTTDVFGGGNGGAIAIQAERVDLNGGAVIGSTTFGAGAGGAITVAAEEALVMSGSGSALRAESAGFSSGAGGQVTITVPLVELSDRAIISTSPSGSGDGGDIVLEVGRLMLTGGAEIRTTAFGSGGAGNLVVMADGAIEVLGEGSRLFTGTGVGSPGRAGHMRLEAPRVEVAGGSVISTSTAEFSPGAAGDLVIVADTLTLSDAIVATSSFDLGPAGDLSITATDGVTITNGSFVSAFSVGSVPAGAITIRASQLEISGSRTLVDAAILTPGGFAPGIGGDVTIDVGSLALTDGAIVEARTIGFGGSTGGTVSVTARDSVTIAGRSVNGVQSGLEAGSFGSGRGGRVVVEAPRLELRDGGSIDAAARVEGSGGAIEVDVGSLLLAGGGRITARTTGEGDAGMIGIDADRISIEGRDSGIVSSTSVAVGAPVVPDRLGNAGPIAVTADRLALRDGGEINSSSTREGRPGEVGDAGNIAIVVADRLEMDRGAITTEAQQSAGGGITLTVGTLVLLGDGSRITSTIFGDRRGDRAGNITIDPRFLILDESDIIARANAGDGGRITIVADNLVRSAGSDIDASSRTGISGTVATSTPEADLSGGLVILEAALLDAASQLRERCASRRDIGASSFTGVGRGGLPPSPDGPLAGAYSSAFGAPGVAFAAQQGGGEGASDEEHPEDRAIWPAVAALAPCHGSW